MEEIIKIENLTKVFKVGKSYITALKDINLSIKKGEIFGIIGLSGAGKSTLVRNINLLEMPTEGKIFFEDKELNKLSNKQLRNVRKEISMIFQSFNLLEQRNVFKNVSFPLELIHKDKKSIEQTVKKLLSLVDLSDKEKAYPSQLSGGQKQRVAIARALATNPKVLLCDEATSALDPKTSQQILELLKKINTDLNVTIVIITHQMSVIENICDKVAIIDHSQIAEVGNVCDIFRNPKSEIGKKLILGGYSDTVENLNLTTLGEKIRLTFKGDITNEPIVANMVLKANEACNILFANMKLIEGKILGEMIIELPKDKEKANIMKDYLTSLGIVYWEVKD